MKIKTLNKEQREICQKARQNQKDHFHNKSFTDLYLDFCKATNYEDTSAENFMVYTKIYGAQSKYQDRQYQSLGSTGATAYAYNRMIKAGESEKTGKSFIEGHRTSMMRRMRNANRG
jgi:hypothetical protein